jgi:hypothetical protein
MGSLLHFVQCRPGRHKGFEDLGAMPPGAAPKRRNACFCFLRLHKGFEDLGAMPPGAAPKRRNACFCFLRLHKGFEDLGACSLDLELTSEAVPSVWLSSLYPFNALRNRALLLARTEAVLLLDVDFLVRARAHTNAAPLLRCAALRTRRLGQPFVAPLVAAAVLRMPGHVFQASRLDLPIPGWVARRQRIACLSRMPRCAQRL